MCVYKYIYIIFLREQTFQALRNTYLETISLLIREDSYQIPQSLVLALSS